MGSKKKHYHIKLLFNAFKPKQNKKQQQHSRKQQTFSPTFVNIYILLLVTKNYLLLSCAAADDEFFSTIIIIIFNCVLSQHTKKNLYRFQNFILSQQKLITRIPTF